MALENLSGSLSVGWKVVVFSLFFFCFLEVLDFGWVFVLVCLFVVRLDSSWPLVGHNLHSPAADFPFVYPCAGYFKMVVILATCLNSHKLCNYTIRAHSIYGHVKYYNASVYALNLTTVVVTEETILFYR